MTVKTINTTIEIFGKFYPIRCKEADIKALHQAAEFLNQKMAEIKDSGKLVSPERIAIITALNIAYQVNQINQRITQLQTKLETAINKHMQKEFLYSSE